MKKVIGNGMNARIIEVLVYQVCLENLCGNNSGKSSQSD